MKKRLRLGSITVLFSVIIIAVAVLSLISEETARADLAVAERYAVEVAERNELINLGEEKLVMIDDILKNSKSLSDISLPQNAKWSEDENDVIEINLSDEERELLIKLKVDISDNISYDIVSYRINGKWTEDDKLNLWH